MWIIGCDYHPGFQQIAFVNQATGECGGRRLEHGNGEAERFYRSLEGQAVRVGIESTGGTRWLERLLAQLGHELWIGDAARIRAAAAHKQKTDIRDAGLLLQLLLENRFPRIWMPSAEQRDLRQLLIHRHRLVQMRARVKNQMQAIAMNEGLQRKQRLWSEAGQAEFLGLVLDPWASRRRTDLLSLRKELDQRIKPLDHALQQQAQQRPETRLLMTHPGVGPVVATAFALTLGNASRFAGSKQVASYLGLVPLEHSSGGRQRLGHITKQGDSMLRGLLVEAVRVAAQREPEWRRRYLRLAVKKNRSIAAVALARRLGVRLWWMWKLGLDYGQMVESHSHAGSSA
jgi:transposase